MRRLILLILVCFAVVLPVSAQTPTPEGPDYTINNLRNRFTPDGLAVVEFEVWNRGGSASIPATALLNILSTGEEVVRATVDPLEAQAIVTVLLSFQVSAFPPDSVQTFRVAVGVGEVEAEGSANIRSNFAPLTITFPALPEGSVTPVPSSGPGAPENAAGILDILRERIPIRWDDPVQVVIAAGITLAVLVGVILLLIVLRLLFSRQPRFETWQPPYANALFLDPNSPAGRRAGWQLAAQNASVPAAAPEGTWHIRKLPSGSDGNYLQSWRITAVRLSQYDPYGRVSRSQVIASRRDVNRLNGALRARQKKTREQLARQLRPAARGMAGLFRKRVNERTSILPVAVDVQLSGKQGDVRILFELYQRLQNAWVLTDQWEPEMLIPGKTVDESFTYSLYGLRAGETLKTFHARFEEDFTALLVEMLVPPALSAPQAQPPPPTPPPSRRADAPTDPHLPTVVT